MTSKHCRHRKEDGFYCQAPALHGRDYCYHHLRSLGRRLRMARALAQREPYHIVLPLLDNKHSIQVAIMQVLDAMSNGLLTEKRGRIMLFGLQLAATNLRSLLKDAAQQDVSSESETGERAEEYAGFEEEFGLPKDIDLNQPPEVVFPPAAEAAVGGTTVVEPSPYRSKPFRYDDIAPEDVELEDIYRTEGEDAYRQREKELTAKSLKEVQQRKREIKRAKYVVEAARRNDELRFGTPDERAQNAAEIQRLRAEAAAQHRAKLEAEAAGRGSEVDRKPPAGAERGSEVVKKWPAAEDGPSVPPVKSGTE